MIKNHLKVAWRNPIKNKASSFINIGGLAVGMTVALLIGIWIAGELSFDQYHENYNRLAQVMQNKTFNGTVTTQVATSLPVEEMLRRDFASNFKHTGVTFWTGSHILATGEKKVALPGTYVTPEIPEMFTLKMIKGSRNSLNGASSILLSRSAAVALFGHTDPLGKVIRFDEQGSLAVSGVYEDLPVNTTFHKLMYMVSWGYFTATQDWLKRAGTDWGEDSFHVFVQVANNVNIQELSAKIRDIKAKNGGPSEAKTNPDLFLQPMRNWHLYEEFKNGVNTGGAIQYVWLFAIVGVFVLLLACINFMNLSTARSEKRAKEVGIRKAVGSVRGQLIAQFYTESLLTALLAFGLSLFLIKLGLPAFNELAGKEMPAFWTTPYFWLAGLGFTLLTGIIAGSYPALYLSSFNPVKVLKGTFKAGPMAAIPRKVLVVTQFTVSIILIVGTIVVFRQVKFAQDRPVGYTRAGLVNIETNDHILGNQFGALRQDMIGSGAVKEMTRSSSPATAVYNNRYDVSWTGKDPALAVDFANIRVTTAYGKTVGWQFIAGRDFSTRFLTDSSAVVLNETAVKYMGLKDPVGQNLNFGKNNKVYKVIGVVRDMVMGSPYEPAKQTIFYIGDTNFDSMILRINPAMSSHEAISKIAGICQRYMPSVPFSYQFVDDAYAQKFTDEERVGKLASAFAALAIFISCLGLFGMASFMAEQRVKEIGVRKVLGATVIGLWSLLSKDFVVLIVIAILIATPVSYYVMHSWLSHYTYHAQLSWWIFALTGVGAVLITLATVSYQSIRAALANPVKSLRSE
ncbi:ABC-type antimicrobial peptide transport system, permease component [Mucilaginibacter mallensis]|uniref:ABC-type antimicrobial peptide transport system, permease component n=1 Tax=Mucilaginibacter mallensis TaxID=652787 RepID=A0A1H1T4T5_MUCMA|nr:ABC transporter permease [Mucilaginibacter mallensis]SDS55218.1 ABC-type antimicrobial peptide transport system, permease component [Mucilaginibacter mallensis]